VLRGFRRQERFVNSKLVNRVLERAEASVAESLRAAGQACGFRTKRPIVEVLGTCAECDAKRNDQDDAAVFGSGRSEDRQPT